MKSSSKPISNEFISLFFCVIKENAALKMYSFNQLEIILDFFSDSFALGTIDSTLQNLFKDCDTVAMAKKQLKYLGVEAFSKDIWKVAKTLDWRKSNKLSRIESKGVEITEGNIIKMGRLKMKVKKIQLFNNRHKRENVVNNQLTHIGEDAADKPIDHNRIVVTMSKSRDKVPKSEEIR